MIFFRIYCFRISTSEAQLQNNENVLKMGSLGWPANAERRPGPRGATALPDYFLTNIFTSVLAYLIVF